MLTFEEKEHVYKWKGRIVPSVTTIIKEYLNIEVNGQRYYVHIKSGSIIPSYIFERAQFIGTEFHKAVKFHISEYGLIEDSLVIEFQNYQEIDMRPMMTQFYLWEEKYKPEYLIVEKPMYSKKYGFAGTPDIYCNITIGRKKIRVLLDIKTGLFHMVSVQVIGGYEQMIRELCHECFEIDCKCKKIKLYKGIIKPYVLSIPKNGTAYKFLPLRDPDAKKEFLALHFDYNYQRKVA